MAGPHIDSALGEGWISNRNIVKVGPTLGHMKDLPLEVAVCVMTGPEILI